VSRSRSTLPVVLLLALVGLVLGIAPADADPGQGKGNGKANPSTTTEPTWAPAGVATITPGAEMLTNGAQCTANFIFVDGNDVFIGYAAHCAATGAANETDGCLADSLPLGTRVEIEGASKSGTLAYSSWLAMQRVNEQDQNACLFNDFALVRIDSADVAQVNPSIPHWGGPSALDTDGTDPGETVHGYGNSGLRLGIRALSPKTGLSLGTTAGGWTHPVYTVTPGIPGDSGGALLDADGAAVGVLSTLVIAPLPGSNNYSDLASALAYMRSHGGPGATLALGTEAFNGVQLPLDLGL
jgi:hypothetical protein